MLYSLIRCGYQDDPRVKKGIDWITKYQRFDDAIEKAPKGWPYNTRIQGCTQAGGNRSVVKQAE